MLWKLNASASRLLFPAIKEKGLSWTLQGLACICAAWPTSQFFWWWATPETAAARGESLATLQDQTQRVLATHLFNVALPQPSSLNDVSQAQLRAPDVRWQLLGTYVGEPRIALLSAEGRSETVVVKVGDRLDSGHEVVKVLADSVVLAKNSQSAELVLRPAESIPPSNSPVDNRFGPAGQPAPPPHFKDPR